MQGKFLIKYYMKMLGIRILFYNHQYNELHLSSLHEFTKQCFAHDQLNYARHWPLYLINIVQLQSDDKQSWNYLKDNYSVSKSATPLTSIASDHAMEQGNKKMKVRGGLTGINQNTAALHRFCLTRPFLNLISEEFFAKFQIRLTDVINHQHCQLTGSRLKRFLANGGLRILWKTFIWIFKTFKKFNC